MSLFPVTFLLFNTYQTWRIFIHLYNIIKEDSHVWRSILQ